MMPSAPLPGIRLRPASEGDLPLIEDRIRFWAQRNILLPLDGPALRTKRSDHRRLAKMPRLSSHRLAEIFAASCLECSRCGDDG